jgi:predicted phage terminase large subunit-like protein
MGALQYVDVPGYSALILRRTFSDLALPGAIMDRAYQWLANTDAKWNDDKKTWTFPSGATLTFGFLDQEKQKYRYQSSEFQFVGFDELTQFLEAMYLYLFSRMRRLRGARVPIRMRSASNPGNIGHEWVRARFVDHKPEIEDKTNIIEMMRKVRPFIPARLEDNPHLDTDEYSSSLEEMDMIEYERLRHGDWDIFESGDMFSAEDFIYVNEKDIPEHVKFLRAWDMAATEKPEKPTLNADPDFSASALVGYDAKADEWYIKDARQAQKNPKGARDFVLDTAEEDTIDVPIRMEQEPGSAGKAVIDLYKREVLRDYDFKGRPSTGKKEVRAKIFSIAVGKRKVKLVKGYWNKMLVKQCVAFPRYGHDDIVDAVVIAMLWQRKKRQARPLGASAAVSREHARREREYEDNQRRLRIA